MAKKKDELTLSELIVTQVAALVDVLEKKGILTKEEYNAEIQEVKEFFMKKREE